jgi:hypothetical protein
MKRSKLKPSLEDTFAVGKLEGEKEILLEIQSLMKDGVEGAALRSYIKARLNSINTKSISDPFKRRG